MTPELSIFMRVCVKNSAINARELSLYHHYLGSPMFTAEDIEALSLVSHTVSPKILSLVEYTYRYQIPIYIRVSGQQEYFNTYLAYLIQSEAML